MKRKPQLTKRERKALAPVRAPSAAHAHIHCVACGKHLEPGEVRTLLCRHGTRYTSCAPCVPESKRLLEEHDLYQRPVQKAAPWHAHDHGHGHDHDLGHGHDHGHGHEH